MFVFIVAEAFDLIYLMNLSPVFQLISAFEMLFVNAKIFLLIAFLHRSDLQVPWATP